MRVSTPHNASAAKAREGAVLLEYHYCGPQVKLCAVDERTGLEVVVVGASATPRVALERVAIAKLRRRGRRRKIGRMATTPADYHRGLLI